MQFKKASFLGGISTAMILTGCKKDDDSSSTGDANSGNSSCGITITSSNAPSLADAFISCWDEKYRSNLVRPETVINKHIDEDWLPLLQTPPFPEYTSGHSVISSAAAIALTTIYGDKFAFDDTSEEEYGLPTRSYQSFLDASAEAAVSRLYGGIHYRPAIDNGVTQGQALGRYLTSQIHLKAQH